MGKINNWLLLSKFTLLTTIGDIRKNHGAMINRTKYNSKTSKGPLVAEWNKCQARFVEEIALLQLRVLRYARRANSRKYSDVINKEQAFLKSKWYMWINSKGRKGISTRLWSLWYLIRTLTTGGLYYCFQIIRMNKKQFR